ncbi:MAG: MFS transporter [Rhizobiales bacterium 62-47]|nr:MFS transporter [Hyphomicrobiales bacterium]OJY08454.1 MAG: MFS transporter [Rhizobiales bacterium 62-47]
MNKFEPESRRASGGQPLTDAQARELSPSLREVIDLSDAPPLAPESPLSQGEVRTILLSLMLTMFLAALDQTIVATALPTIGRQFHDVANLSWIITAYLLASTAVAPVFGTLSDIYGRKAMIIVSLSLFIAGSVVCALAPNMTVLILARGLQGLGGGGIMPLVQTIISDVVTPRERGQYQAYFSGVWVSAGIGGPILGGVFAEHLHWSMIFWINVPLALLGLGLLLPRMARIPVFHRMRKVDWLGGVLLMASAVLFTLLLTWGGTRFAWLSTPALAMMGVTVLLALAFVWHALRTAEPFLPLPLLAGRVVPFGILAGGCAVGAMVGLTVHLPIYYLGVYQLSASEAGLALIPLVAVSVLGAATAGRTMATVKRYKRVAIAGTGMAVLTGLVMMLATPLPLWALLSVLSVFAFGLGTTFPVSVVSIQNAVAKPQVGTVTGAMNFFRALMASFAVAAMTTILLIALGTELSGGVEQADAFHNVAAGDMVAAFRYVFAGAVALVSVSFLCMVLMEERTLAGPAKPPMEMAE